MPDIDLGDIRRVRANALDLLSYQTTDIEAFFNSQDFLTFRRLPQQSSKRGDVKVTSSCSCLMSLALSKQFRAFNKHNESTKKAAKRAFQRIYNASWRSSGLGLNNAFSTTMVIRTFGLLVEAGILAPSLAATQKRNYSPLGRVTLNDIAKWLACDIKRFGINKYPPSAALVYWFVDGVVRGKIPLGAGQWRLICNWARHEFNKQRSLVVAQHEALMDPIAMAMAACLCARLRKVAYAGNISGIAACLQLLPSSIELEHGIDVLFSKQGPSGIWPKYFPLFHYPKAGSNYCFTFEMLEAVLSEFGHTESQLLATPVMVRKLESALNWCVKNRLKFPANRKIYWGWNSGGELDSLNAEQPESWATAVAHMFLWELQHMLAVNTQAILLREYKATPAVSNRNSWTRLLDVNVHLQGSSSTTTVKTVLEAQLIRPALNYKAFSGEKIDGRVSALLFGPPGTSKTQIANSLAATLGWPVVLIDPSQFLSKGIEHIYSRATEIFRDLQDLSAVVILFDEMDALVRTRDGQRIDLTSQFLTTSMLPKLASLHNQASLVFLFATNYQNEFDPAIKRPGRFDVLLCMGPSSWREKLKHIDRFLPADTEEAAIKYVKKKLLGLSKDLKAINRKLLNLLTFQETQNYLESLAAPDVSVVEAILIINAGEFEKRLASFCHYITLRSDGDTYKRYIEDLKESRLQ
ncbi:MAG TPA: ATP-binding protein [Candidatus Saccharimonadales bacterium]|nr:ATP-binding protein [Candidatus Saccharimonadales bacterium]